MWTFLYSILLLGLPLAIDGRQVRLEALVADSEADGHLFSVDNPATQSVFSKQSPWTEHSITTGPNEAPTTSKENLINAVRDDIQSQYPSVMDVSQSLVNITGLLHHVIRFKTGEVKQIDIQFPLMDTCTTRVSDVRPVAQGIYCIQESCSYTRSVTLTDEYSSTFGFSVSTTITAAGSIYFVKASVATTYQTSYEKTWSHGSSSSDQYTFNLKQDERCTPSMAHLELECDLADDKVFYDTFWYYSTHRLWLEENPDYHRTGGRHQGGQWCRVIHVDKNILRQDKFFDFVLKEDTIRGAVWLRPSSEINEYKLDPKEPKVTDNQIVIRKGVEGEGGDFSEVFVCDRYLQSRVKEKARIPLSNSDGSLPGYVACVPPN